MQVVACGGCGQAVLPGQPAVRRGAVTMHQSCAWRTVLTKAKAEIERLKAELRGMAAEVIASRNEALEFRRQRDTAMADSRKNIDLAMEVEANAEREIARLRRDNTQLSNERWNLTQELARATNPLNIVPSVQRLPPPATMPVAPPTPSSPPVVEGEARDDRDATEIRFSLLDLD